MDFNEVAKKWQKKWDDAKIFHVKEDPKKPKFYCLEMYPYPSGSSMHMGHVRNYTIGDIYARFKRMNGFNVLYPMGYDAFGLPAENAAIKNNIHPRAYTEKAIATIKQQQKELGLSYDWSRQLASCDLDYYKWNQWFFLKFLEKGIAYRKKAPINWCPLCSTVLANEQVVNGKCWRHEDCDVEIKQLEQWFLKITDYADRLIDDLDKIRDKWPDQILTMQKNWIGRSEGTEVNFKIDGTNDVIPVFTTRADTLFGVRFLVYAPEHPKVAELVKGTKYENGAKEFVKKVVVQEKFQRSSEDTEKEGMFIGKYAINPLTGDKVPIYIGNFVLLEYGAGAVMAVPAHDQRDFEFAKKYKIPIKVVIDPVGKKLDADTMKEAYVDDGVLVNSKEFSGLNNRDAIKEIQTFLEKKKLGKKIVQYKLRDWLISRQRYWGTPIPIVYCEKCGTVPVPEKDLPVQLPDDVKFTGNGNPLLTSKTFLDTKCPKCSGKARRETDTMDGFMDSCWYFLRYTSPHYAKGPFIKENVQYWMPVDQYIGGAEHAVMHLLYARFFCKVLKDLKLIDFDEPFARLFNQGIVYKDGAKMSKSKGNIVTQEEIAKKYGIDTARFFLMFVASPDKLMEWSDQGIEGSFRFLNKVTSLLEKKQGSSNHRIKNKMHRAIKDVTHHIEHFEYNKAIIEIMSYANYLSALEEVPKDALETLILLISPFTPHLAEEMWSQLGHKDFIVQVQWPKYEEKFIDDEIEFIEDATQSLMSDIDAVMKMAKIQSPKQIKLIISEKWKYEYFNKLKEILSKTFNVGDVMKQIMSTHLKSHGQDIMKMTPLLVKDQSRIPKIVLDQDKEFKAFKETLKSIENVFKAPVILEKAEESKEAKARQANPGKPAIVIQ